jgi:hypothetical protein
VALENFTQESDLMLLVFWAHFSSAEFTKVSEKNFFLE